MKNKAEAIDIENLAAASLADALLTYLGLDILQHTHEVTQADWAACRSAARAALGIEEDEDESLPT